MKRFLLCILLLACLIPAAMADTTGDDAEDGEVAIVVAAKTLVQGDFCEEVASLQLKLSQLYYYDGEISGSFGDLTKAAVKAFQYDFGLPETGEADAETQMLLFAAEYRPLRLGSTGVDVRLLQGRLTELGYYTGKISGTYLPATQDAVYTFQLVSGEKPTGSADVDTLTLLYSANAVSWEEGQHLMPEVSPTPNPYDVIAAVTPTPGPVIPYTKTLKYEESSGQLVKQLQERLTELGYYSGNISGNFLGHTRNAVKAFQEQNALKADGIVGQMTWDAMFNDPDVRGVNDEAKPAPPVPYAITVDVTNQVTTVYGLDDKGEYTVIVRQMLCSTGTKATPSDVGDWVLSGRTARWCYFPQWGGHAQFWTKINGSIAFHSVIYADSKDTMSLKVSSYNNLGKRASHGCIRLTVADAKWIYDNCGEGVVVTITEDLPADPELRAALKLPSLNKQYMLPYVTATPTPAPSYVPGELPPGEFKTLKKNSSGEAVYWLQSKLAALGYYQGHIGGKYLDGTVKAVKAFQKDHGLTANGTADVKTLKAIYAAELATPTPAPTATPAPEIASPIPTTSIFPE
ncbi:MAG: hypothetical protein E7327_02255 [Clostridiales bacterium]|nr:hypothetical protein [Clostridiales bacterium]